ncbi:MAG: PEP-CTERM sorting domain-containing protein [Pirellulales bacterium]|nr:PEP-CTERM sorting domain-containing protein [Pirellulales bacterium]
MKLVRFYLSQTLLYAAIAASIFVTLSSAATAQVSNFSVQFNANAGILATDPNTAAMTNAMMGAQWNLPSTLLMDFNSAALRVFNDASSTGNITQLALTIGDDRFNFANFFQTSSLLLPAENDPIAAAVVMQDNSFLPFSSMSAIATTEGPNPMQVAAGDDNADRIVINFGNGGIAPGNSALFEVRFEFDDSIAIQNRPMNEPLLGISGSIFPQHYPSFQRILFDTNAPNPPFFSDPIDLMNLSDNAMVTATFDNNLQPSPIMIPDRNDLRTTIANFDHPQPEFQTTTVTIPEPASVVIFLAGLIGWAPIRRRRMG